MTGLPTGEVMAFGPLAIAFDDRVLRPRPWTAAQSQWAAELLRTLPDGPVLELCTGAGHIGLLAVALEPRPLVCVDVDPVACDFARRNAATAGLHELVEVRQRRIDDAARADEQFALVIADPPWVRAGDTDRFPEDPLLAIDGGGDGLDVARLCAAAASRHLVPGGAAVFQLGTTEQAEALGAELPTYGGLVLTEVRRFERGVLARLDR